MSEFAKYIFLIFYKKSKFYLIGFTIFYMYFVKNN
jgi:hypothetical protein